MTTTTIEIEAIEHLDFGNEIACEASSCDARAIGVCLPTCKPEESEAQCPGHRAEWVGFVEEHRDKKFRCKHCSATPIEPDEHFRWEPL